MGASYFSYVPLLLLYVLLGLLATAPFGAVLGSIVKTSGSGWGLSLAPLIILVAISGIFYPITALWGWVQVVAQVFPVYWLGLGFRSIFSPEAAAALEIGGSWRTWETIGVLTAWAIGLYFRTAGYPQNDASSFGWRG